MTNENNSSKKRYIGMCELFHPHLYGFDNNSDPQVMGNWIVSHSTQIIQQNTEYEYYSESEDESASQESDSDNDDNNSLDFNNSNKDNDKAYDLKMTLLHLDTIRRIYKLRLVVNEHNRSLLTHSFIRNYNNIVKSHKYMKPEIIEKVYLKGGECCAIIKTFWLRIVQRTWRRILKERKKIIQLRKRPSAIMNWQLKGKWPDDCLYIPGLINMITI
jgi:hypothetical protein